MIGRTKMTLIGESNSKMNRHPVPADKDNKPMYWSMVHIRIFLSREWEWVNSLARCSSRWRKDWEDAAPPAMMATEMFKDKASEVKTCKMSNVLWLNFVCLVLACPITFRARVRTVIETDAKNVAFAINHVCEPLCCALSTVLLTIRRTQEKSFISETNDFIVSEVPCLVICLCSWKGFVFSRSLRPRSCIPRLPPCLTAT